MVPKMLARTATAVKTRYKFHHFEEKLYDELTTVFET